MPKGCSVVKNYHPLDCSHLEKSFTIINQEIESKCNEEETKDCANAHSEDTETYQDDSEEKTVEVDLETAQDPQAEMSGRNWKISKCVDGNLMYVHINAGFKTPFTSRIYLAVAKAGTGHHSISLERNL